MPPVIDFHTHIYPDWLQQNRLKYLGRDNTFAQLFPDQNARMSTADELILAMDEDGIDHAVVMGIGWTDPGLAYDVNDYLIESVRRFPTRLTGFAGVNPKWGQEAAREADRCALAGLKGIGELHPDSQDFDLGDYRIMGTLMEVVQERDLIVTTHSSEPVGHVYPGKGRTTPEILMRFITRYPDVKIVCAHWGGGLLFYSLMPEIKEALSNVYFDTAASPFLYDLKVFKSGVSLVGSGSILLGSDYPIIQISRLLDQIQEAGLSDPDRNAIIGTNAAKLLGINESFFI